MITNIDLIDFHSHILPGVDHGSSSLETSVSQMQFALKHNIKRLFATSHFYPARHNVDTFLKKRNEGYRKLLSEAKCPLPEIRLGAEVMVCENIHKLDGISDLCIYGTKTLLLELPFFKLEEREKNAVIDLKDAGFDVVIAHADRYEKEFIDSLIPYGVKLQINADSIAKLFPRKEIFGWMKAGVVARLGSDIHGAFEKNYKLIDKAKKKATDYIPSIAEKSNEIWNASCEFVIE